MTLQYTKYGSRYENPNVVFVNWTLKEFVKYKTVLLFLLIFVSESILYIFHNFMLFMLTFNGIVIISNKLM